MLKQYNREQALDILKEKEKIVYLISKKIIDGRVDTIVTTITRKGRLLYVGYSNSSNPDGFSCFANGNPAMIDTKLSLLGYSHTLGFLRDNAIMDATNIYGNTYGTFCTLLNDLKDAQTEFLFGSSHYDFFKKYKELIKNDLARL